MDVSIIMVTYNSAKYIPPCFDSIKKYMKGLSYEMIVVDNCSADETVSLVLDHWPNVLLIENKINVGFAAANNQAAFIARGDFLFLLNADTQLLDDGILDALRYAHDNGTAVLGPKTFGIEKVPLKTWKDDNSLYYHMLEIAAMALFLKRLFKSSQSAELDIEREVKFLTGSAMLISRKVYEQFGLFDERFFFMCEERDLCMRLTKSGLKLVYFPGWSIFHYVSYGNQNSPFHYVNWVKSSLKLARKHGGLAGYAFMIVTFGLYSVSYATTSTIKQLLDFSDPGKSCVARTSRNLLYWYLGFLSEKNLLEPQ